MNTVLHFLGYKAESFSASDAINEHAKNSPGLFATGIFIFILSFGFGILYCYGSAKLSYDYNMSINNTGMAFMWAVLCYIFPVFYYPYYAIFLNPINSSVSVAPMSGGRRRKL